MDSVYMNTLRFRDTYVRLLAIAPQKLADAQTMLLTATGEWWHHKDDKRSPRGRKVFYNLHTGTKVKKHRHYPQYDPARLSQILTALATTALLV